MQSIPASLRPLFLAIARASIASAGAGCASEHLAAEQNAGERSPDATLPGAAQHSPDAAPGATEHDSAVVPPLGDAALPPDARVDQDAAAPSRDAGVPATNDGGTASNDAAAPSDGGTASDAAAPSDGGADWAPVPCTPGYQVMTEVDAVHLAREVDGVIVYTEGFSLPGSGRYAAPLAQAGGVCSTAADPTACEAQLTMSTRPSGCPDTVCRFVVTGRAGAIERLDTREELLALLGAIDTPAEAALLAEFDGHRMCRGVGSDSRDTGGEIRIAASGYELRVTRESCGSPLYRDHLTVTTDGGVSLVDHMVLKPSTCTIGRRPAGLRDAATLTAQTKIGAFLAQAAHLEAASVHAFYKLLRELRALGAPDALRKAALDAMLDEVRHAQDVSALAQAYGAEVAKPEVATTALRSAYELALDNIGEGCVRETFGALQATYQAETAADPRVRTVMAQIAEDESRHAELAWQLQAWLEPRLSEAERAHVRAERTRVLDALAGDLCVDLSREECAALGYPTPEVSSDMLRSMSQALYA